MNNPELGQVFTSAAVADYMVSLFDIDKSGLILDPCFGGGAFLRALERASFQNVIGYEIDEYWYNKAVETYHMAQLQLGDFLKSDGSNEFDGIIMNPPYIRQEKIDDLSESGITKKELFSNNLYNCLPKTANLYMFFIVKAIDMLKENGEMIVIFPSSWMSARGGKSFKNYIDTHTCVTKQIDVYGEVFEGDALVEVSILKMVKRKGPYNTVIEKYKVFNGEMVEDKLDEIFESFILPTSFSKYATVRRGLTTGYNEAFINPKTDYDIADYLVPIISSPKSFEGFNTDQAKTDMLLCISEKDILSESLKEYLDTLEKSIIQNKTPKTIFEKIEHNKSWYTLSVFPCNGILFSYFVRSEMKFAMNTAGSMIRDNFYIIYPSIDPFLMMALLNNYYTYYQLEKNGKKYGAGLLKIQRYDIEALTFPDIDQLSDADTTELITLSKNLVSTGDKGLVDHITELLASSIGESYDHIKEAFTNIRSNRLERV